MSRPELAAENKDIVITATTSREPVLQRPLAGARGRTSTPSAPTSSARRSWTRPRSAAAPSVVVDSKDQARLEAGDFQQALEDGSLHWADVRELGQVIVGRYPGRKQPQDVTLFKSLGIAIEDVATAARVYARAQAEGVGKAIDW